MKIQRITTNPKGARPLATLAVSVEDAGGDQRAGIGPVGNGGVQVELVSYRDGKHRYIVTLDSTTLDRIETMRAVSKRQAELAARPTYHQAGAR